MITEGNLVYGGDSASVIKHPSVIPVLTEDVPLHDMMPSDTPVTGLRHATSTIPQRPEDPESTVSLLTYLERQVSILSLLLSHYLMSHRVALSGL